MPDLDTFVRRLQLVQESGLIAVGSEYPSGTIVLEFVDRGPGQVRTPRQETYHEGVKDVRERYGEESVEWLD